MEHVKSVRPRICLIPDPNYLSIEIHCFSDASEEAFASACYIRVVYNDWFSVNIMYGKGKLAPRKKTMTVPRLELLAACLGVRVVEKVRYDLKSSPDISRVIYWVDAKSVLALIRNTETRFPVFVSNRLSEIHDFTTPKLWRYCPSDLNCADKGTRVIMPSKLDCVETWINGPPFLLKAESEWPKQDVNLPISVISACLKIEAKHDPFKRFFERCSSLRKLQRAVVYLSRFKKYLWSKTKRSNLPPITSSDVSLSKNPISVSELESSLFDLCRIVQNQVFSGPMEHLTSGGRTKLKPTVRDEMNSIQSLCPFVDKDGLLRVGGRLQRSNLPEGTKHPIILPKRHMLTDLVVRHYHTESRHYGYEYVLSQTRHVFWILRGKSTVKFYTKDCYFCKVRRAAMCKQLMAPLPKERTTAGGRPWQICGCDFFGPEKVKIGVNGRKTDKRYGCIFVCFRTRAVHIEMVYSLTMDSFISAFLRFYYTRGGAILEVWSDNATNFVSAAKELSADNWFDEKLFKDTLAKKGVDWNFIPSRSPHQGGIWERMVKEVKHLLSAVYNEECYRTLSDEEYMTYLKEIENILNWRPLTSTSDDPADFSCLSPHSILSMGLLPASPAYKPLKRDAIRKCWRTVQLMSEDFWKRWVDFYLPTLQKRSKWTSVEKNVKQGDLVLIIDSNLLRNEWSRGRITQTFPNKDGLVRRVEVITPQRKKFIRDIRHICLLEGDATD